MGRGAEMEAALSPGWGRQGERARPLWAAAAGWLRGLTKSPEGALLRVEARVSLGGKKSLVLVSCRGRRVLLAVSGEAITPVMEMAAERARKREAR